MDSGHTRKKLKRTKRDRETKDREWVSVSEIRPVLSTVQRSKAECEFQISERRKKFNCGSVSLMHMDPRKLKATHSSHMHRRHIFPCLLFPLLPLPSSDQSDQRCFVIAHPRWCNQRERGAYPFRDRVSPVSVWQEPVSSAMAAQFSLGRHSTASIGLHVGRWTVIFSVPSSRHRTLTSPRNWVILVCVADVSHALPPYLLMS